MSEEQPAVLLLQSKLRDSDCALGLDLDPLIALARWQVRPTEHPRPTRLEARRGGGPRRSASLPPHPRPMTTRL